MHSSGDDGSESQDVDYFLNFPNGHHEDNPFGSAHDPYGNERDHHHRSIINWSGDVKYSSWFLYSPLFLQWTPVHHFYYQLGQFCILLLLVMNLNKKQRVLIVLYSVFHCLWGWFVMRSMDMFVWGVIITVFNILSAVWTLCSDWPLRFRAENEMVSQLFFWDLFLWGLMLKCEMLWSVSSIVQLFVFPHNCKHILRIRLITLNFLLNLNSCMVLFALLQVYKKLFMPLKVSRRQFKRVLDCKRNVKILHAGDHYAVEKCTRVDSLALVLSGR